jgi:hypothetical protein
MKFEGTLDFLSLLHCIFALQNFFSYRIDASERNLVLMRECSRLVVGRMDYQHGANLNIRKSEYTNAIHNKIVVETTS